MSIEKLEDAIMGVKAARAKLAEAENHLTTLMESLVGPQPIPECEELLWQASKWLAAHAPTDLKDKLRRMFEPGMLRPEGDGASWRVHYEPRNPNGRPAKSSLPA